MATLYGESAIGGPPSVKLPPKVKVFIDKVICTPLQNIAIPLSGFRWEYSKGNFHHWSPLFLHFDKYFNTYLSSRDDMLLSDKILADKSQFPKHDVLQILRVMKIILENCPNKNSFDGLEHFKLLLASTDPDVLVATLETLVALVKIIPSKHREVKLIGIGSVTSYILSLAQGWGSKEEGLGLYSFIVATERTQEGLNLFQSDAENEIDRSQHRVGSTLYFEFPEQNLQEGSDKDAVSSKLKVILIPDLHLREEDDLWLMKHCLEQYQVPTELRFALLTRIRYAHAFRSPHMCRHYSSICLLAFIVLVQSSDASEELVSFFINEPEYTNEMIRIVCSEEVVPLHTRKLAMLALGAQSAAYKFSHEMARVVSRYNISFVGGNRTTRLNVLQKTILSLSNSNDTNSNITSSVAFFEALLQIYLFDVFYTSTTGSILRTSEINPTLLPLLKDPDPSHTHLVCLAVKILRELMGYSDSAVSAFKQLGGVELLTQRLQVEVHRVIKCGSGSESLMSIGDNSKSSLRLIKDLLKALTSAGYSPRDAARSQNADNLPANLSLILGNVDKFGGDVHNSALRLMGLMIHRDQTCFSMLNEMGLPDALLSSVVSGVIPSSKHIKWVVFGIDAICLKAKDLESVKVVSALRFLVDVSTTKKYALAMKNNISNVALTVHGLLSERSSLISTSVDLVIEIIDKITAMKDGSSTKVSEKTAGRTEMELDSEHNKNDHACSLVNDAELDAEEISNEQFMQLGIYHLMALLKGMIDIRETCRLFVEKSGIEALLKLLLRPSIVQSSKNARGIIKVFGVFTRDHSAPLARAFCSSLRDQLNSGLSSSLLVEFLLLLADSKGNRWVAAFLTEFRNDSKDVVGDIGRLHREGLWQVAILEDSRHESKDIVSGSGDVSHQSELSTSETGDQRFYSFRQILDPLFRRTSSSLTVESQFIDLLNLYRDFGRTATFQQRNVQGSSNLQSVGSQQVDHSTSPNSTTILSECDRKRSYHTSCCDMERSLASPIIHLFQELGKTMLHPSHPRDDTLTEETPEDDDFARALAVSLGKSEFDTTGDAANDATQHLEEDMAQLPPIEELLLNCTRLWKMKESFVFPVRDLLVTICSQNDGQSRSSIISFVVDQLKDCNLSHGGEHNTLISALFHVIALVFLEDPVAREVALKNGLVKFAIGLLSQWESSLIDKSNIEVPKWVTTAFLAIDQLLQADKKVDSEIIEQLKKEGDDQQSVLSVDEDKQRKLQSAFGSSMELIDVCEQKRLIEISCNSIRSQLPSETMHAVLQLCSTLTRSHSIAVNFLDLGGLASLLSLPTSSLFPGFNSIAAAIIGHIVEDPQTLQQAMESEIKHNFNSLSNERFSARNFLLNLNNAIGRDPVIFMLAAENICQVKMVGDRAYIVLQKDSGKDQHKEIIERQKNKGAEKEKPQSAEGKAGTCNLSLSSPGSGRGKIHDAKCAEAQEKTSQSFINVVELLVDSIAAFVPQMNEVMQTDPTPTDMDFDGTPSEGDGKAVAVVTQVNEACSQETETSLAKIVFMLKLLTEFLLMYSSSAHVLLRLDTEISSSSGLTQRASSGVCAGGLFHHVIRNFLPYACSSKEEKKPDGDWRHMLATRATKFLLAACVRSTEAKKRVLGVTNCILNEFVASCSGIRPPRSDLQAYVDLLGHILTFQSSTSSMIINDVSATFMDVGLVKSFTRILQVLDLDHSDSPNVIEGLIKALEFVTREHDEHDNDDDECVTGLKDYGSRSLFLDVLDPSSGSVIPSRHPLLVGPSLLAARQSESSHDLLLTGRTSSSRLAAVLGTLRYACYGYQMNLPLPQGFEELLVSQLRRPGLEKPVDQNTTDEQQDKGEGSQFQAAEAGERPETTVENHTSNETSNAPPSSSANDASSKAEGAPLVDSESLQAIVRLLHIFKPLFKVQLQKLLLNLCVHSETRTCIVRILMNMLILDKGKPIHNASDNDSSFRLYYCQRNVVWSRYPLSDGVPPLVSRRTLETLTYLAKRHPNVAKIFLQFRPSLPLLQARENVDEARGKAVVVGAGETGSQQREYFTVGLILGLLNQPLYLRSMAHLEQLLNLLDVIIDYAGSKETLGDKPWASTAEQSAPHVASTNTMNIDSGYVGTSSKVGDSSKVLSSPSDMEYDSHAILLDLPRSKLQLMCSLLAREGLSDNVYTLLEKVLKRLGVIVPAYCHLFITELADAGLKLAKSNMNELHVFGETVEALLSRTGTTIMRVLQVVSSLVASLTDKDKDQQLLFEEDRSSTHSEVSIIIAALEPLWLELSTCISNFVSYSDSISDLPTSSNTLKSKKSSLVSPLPAGSQNILPYIESFFVTCEKLHSARSGSWHDFAFVMGAEEAGNSDVQQKNMGSTPKIDERNIALVKFCEKHQKLLNAFMRQNSELLEKSFSIMLMVPRFIDYDNKCAHFQSKIKHLHDPHHRSLRISVSRDNIFEDSYKKICMYSSEELTRRLIIHFEEEEGFDAGGLTREWYQLLSRCIFDKRRLLFTTVGSEPKFQPNPNSKCQDHHLSYFTFAGTVVGKALFDGQLLDVNFTRSFYKHILEAEVTYHDFEDPDYYKSLKWVLENDISDVLHLTFSIDADEEKLILYESTKVTDYELIPGGRNIKVTEENKHHYVDLVAEYRLKTAIQPQINAFLEGFNGLIPGKLISIFNVKELELLISGLPDIDVDDLRANTTYSGYSAGSPVIQWFWEVVQSFSKEDKACLLQFVTGSPKVSSGPQKFQIHKAYASPDHLPCAHTCLYQLDLPEYPSKEHLKERLLLAIREANEGFGFG